MIDHPTLAQLWSAAQVCDPCGCTWGRPNRGEFSYWHGRCHICGLDVAVSSVRNYGYLRRGLGIVQKLELTLATATSKESDAEI